MNEEQRKEVEDFLADIEKNLADVYHAMVACLDEHDGFSPAKMFEQFFELTNRAMRNGDEATLTKHLAYISRKLSTAQGVCFEMIDVYYVESLMWNVDPKESKWAWGHFPQNIKDLYIKMWGEPRF